jgi:PAS domain S-box-containing protein
MIARVDSTLEGRLAERSEEIFRRNLDETRGRTDRLFAGLMFIQWIGGIVLALVVTPSTWVGATDTVHIHVWSALLLGALFMGPGIGMAFLAPGRALTRHVIAAGQVLESALLIHLTGGRIETHFHIFGSLAFLSFYRDWRVLVTATAIVAGDHLLRGLYWPQSVYGILYGGNLRWLEHAGWVAFIDAFLIRATFNGLREMRDAASRQTTMEAHGELVDREVELRTRELRASEEKFREMAEHIDQVFWITTPDLAKILYISPGYEKIWGRSPAELAEHPESWAESIHPDDRERVWKLASNHHVTGEYQATYRIIRPDGSLRWVFDHGKGIRNEKGEVIRLVGSVVDITALKAVEEELIRSNEELQRFAYVASHDLQEPLRSVSSFLQLLQRKYQGRLDSDADEYIGFAVDGAHRMKRLIGDLLAYSRIDNQAKPPEPAALDSALDVALENLKGAIQESGAAIVRDPLPTVKVDEAQLAQVFQNLIGNAIKFRGERALEIRIGAEKTDSGWTVHVRDNGIGIESQYAERIFVIFQRLHGQKYPGSGIGLTICKKIVERHQGRIRMESAPGEGTAFYFTLPDPVPSKPVAIKAPPAPRRVLVVDDDLLVCKLIRKNLEPMGMIVEEAHTGPEGIGAARRMKPDMLFLDVNLPGQDGNQVRRTLKEAPATRGIPVIMITGEPYMLDPELARAADWLPKPFSMDDLRKRVQSLVPSGS